MLQNIMVYYSILQNTRVCYSILFRNYLRHVHPSCISKHISSEVGSSRASINGETLGLGFRVVIRVAPVREPTDRAYDSHYCPFQIKQRLRWDSMIMSRADPQCFNTACYSCYSYDDYEPCFPEVPHPTRTLSPRISELP